MGSEALQFAVIIKKRYMQTLHDFGHEQQFSKYVTSYIIEDFHEKEEEVLRQVKMQGY
jgi:hypothetical protein